MSGEIERLDVGAVPECLALARSRGWSAQAHKWRLLVELGEVYGIRDERDGLVGTAVLTRYGEELAVVSMVLVAGAHGGRGLGRRLMEHALARSGRACVTLNATDLGRPLYQKLGFATVGRTRAYLGRLAPQDGAVVSRPAVAGDLAAIRALDRRVLGADRGELVARLPGFTDRLRVLERDGEPAGYAGAWPNGDHVVVGPVLAPTEADARALIADVVRSVDVPVRLDLDESRAGLRSWAVSGGLRLCDITDVMALRGPVPGDRHHWFVPVMQALG